MIYACVLTKKFGLILPAYRYFGLICSDPVSVSPAMSRITDDVSGDDISSARNIRTACNVINACNVSTAYNVIGTVSITGYVSIA